MTKSSELVLDVSSFGIEESKAEQLKKVFVPMVVKFKELEEQYKCVLADANKEMTKQVCIDAKTIKNKYVKVRTETDDTHQIAKKSNLIEGRAIDGLRNLVKYACFDHEKSLMEVAKHFERIETERLDKLREERESILEKYDVNPGVGDPALMSEDVWKHYINSVETTFQAKIAAEKKAESERIEKEKEAIKEQKRIKAENNRLKKEAELKLISDEKEEKERQRLAKIEQDKRYKQEKERQLKAELERKEHLAKQEQERDAYEYKLAKEHVAREKIQKELEAKQEQERKDKEAEDLRAKKEADENRKLALAPEKERLSKWVDSMEIIEIDYEKMKKESALTASLIIDKFNSFKAWAKSEIDKIK